MTTREKILEHLESHHYRPMKLRRLSRFFDVAEEDYAEFRVLVKRMIRDGEIAAPAGKLRLLRKERPHRGRARTVEGRFSLSARGFGFVEPDAAGGPTEGEDLFIPPDETLDAVTGDTVLAEVAGKGRRGYFGRIVEVRERGGTRFVGTYYATETGPVVRPDGGVLLQAFAVPDASSAGAHPKDKVVFEVLRYALRGEPGEAVIVEVLGKRGDPGVDTLAVIRQFDLPDEFPDAVLADARRAADRLGDAALRGRRDLTGETIITIDPEDSRDFDDAIGLTEHDDGSATLGVHIADVAHFVRPGSPLDEEARQRGTSVYLPTTVLPMLPEILSNGVCSLQQGRTRLTKSVFITFSEGGEPVDVDLANSFLKSSRRLTYKQATAALGSRTQGLGAGVVRLLRGMERLARRLLERRRRLGYLELDLPDVDLEFSDEGRVVAAHPEDTSFSHRIIEMFMVEANEAVARQLDRAGVTCIRRIHPDPDDDAAEELKAYARSIGYRLKNPRSRHDLQRLLAAVRGKPEAYGVHLAVLRSLAKAEYSIEKEEHFALGSSAYCHFTSPIRRYPDLTVHRLFAEVARGSAKKQRGGRRKKAPARARTADGRSLAEVAAHCSRTERRAEAAERELTKIKLLEFLQARIGETFTGIVTGVQAFGAFVENPELLIDGLVHISSLSDDRYRFDRRRLALVGHSTGRELRVGSTLEVRIAGVDIARRQLDLEPVEAERRRRPSAKADAKKTDLKKTGQAAKKPTRAAKRAGRGRAGNRKKKRR